MTASGTKRLVLIIFIKHCSENKKKIEINSYQPLMKETRNNYDIFVFDIRITKTLQKKLKESKNKVNKVKKEMKSLHSTFLYY